MKALKESLKEVDEANKGFFIGSRAYSQTMRGMSKALRFMEKMGDYPSLEDKAKATKMLEETIEKCQKYLDSKDPGHFRNEREEKRYNAMKNALESCKSNLEAVGYQERARRAEERRFREPEKAVESPVHSSKEIHEKIEASDGEPHRVSGEKIMDAQYAGNRIPASNVGNVADELRADIHRNLSDLVNHKKEFDDSHARNIMSNMVVLEMVLAGRSFNDKGEIVAGPLEEQLARKPAELIMAVRNSQHFQQMTQNVTRDMLENFIVTGGAKTIATAMANAASNGRTAIQEEPAMEKQMENGPVMGQK